MYKRAFTLVELIIAITIFSMMSLLMLNHLNLLCNKKKTKYIEECIAIDLIRKDLWQASSKIEDWDIQNLVFKVGNTHIGWKYSKNKLIRIEGQYSFVLKLWNNKVETIVNKEKFDFNIVKNLNDIEKVKIKFTFLETIVCIRKALSY